tara:strand:+ start:1369 stop:1992 length:624 start_codon:yes stop_codon:yes gene_type:complete
MNLTKEIKNRKIGFEPKVKVSNNRIEIEKIGIGIELSGKFTVADKSEFRNFISDYEFPKNLELSKKDREGFEKELFEPIFTLSDKENNRPIIACYLFNVNDLKGNTNLNIRSITKYELMWAEYVLESKNNRRVNVKRVVTNGINGSISENYWFAYKSKSTNSDILSRLRILNLEINDYVLTFYIVDDEQNALSETELEKFINGIKVE